MEEAVGEEEVDGLIQAGMMEQNPDLGGWQCNKEMVGSNFLDF